MNFESTLKAHLSPLHLLNHCFYQAWTDGDLPPERIGLYARQYFHHVKSFPRYLSSMHAQCEDITTRQLLLENLIDEERGESNHPALWERFVRAWGENTFDPALPETKNLVDTFFALARASMPEALGALYAYEHQVPEIAAFKIEALAKHYPMCSPAAREFFEVHRTADVYHREALAKVLNELSPADAALAQSAALKASQALWGFLDGVEHAPLA